MAGRYWEDFAPGWSEEIGPRPLSPADELRSFAWRLATEGDLRQVSLLGSNMVQRLAQRAAARPGELLTLRTVVTAAAPLQDRGDRGVIEARHELRNAAGRVVLEIDSLSVLERRRPAPRR
jgi:hypothetical protein